MTYQNTINNLQQTAIEDGTTSITFDTQLLATSGLTLVPSYNSVESCGEELTFNFDITEDSNLVFGEQGFDIDVDQLELIPTTPIESDSFLLFEGDPSDNQGLSGFLNPSPGAPDSGHLEISLNSPGFPAPYYATGRQSNPLATDETRSATLDSNQNLTNFADYLSDNQIDTAEIGFSFGQKSDRDFTETWNAGEDLLGQDWLASPDSTIEERISQADPDAVETFLLFGDTPIVSFDYSPLYAVLDYGETLGNEDDIDIFFTEAIGAQKVDDLDPVSDGLADAFLEDLSNREVQVVVEDSAVENLAPNFDPDTGFVVADVPLPLSIRIVDDVDLNESSDSDDYDDSNDYGDYDESDYSGYSNDYSDSGDSDDYDVESDLSDLGEASGSIFDGQDFFTAIEGAIKHSGDLTFETLAGDITASELSIGFDAARQTEDISGFFVESSLSGVVHDETVLFDLGSPNNIETDANELSLDYADVLITPEFSEVLLSTGAATDDLVGIDVGDLAIDAIAESFSEVPMDYV
ncbi:MAG: hypothetical protein AAFY50_17930 [Cyanobacteria bacterium J06648_1]